MKKKENLPSPISLRLGSWLLSCLARYEKEYSISGDIREEYRLRVQVNGKPGALVWYWREILHALRTYLKLSAVTSGTMLLNYLKISFRNIKKQRTTSFISLSGLAIGMACFILISLYVRHELNYDRYHRDADRIFRVVVHTKFYTMRTLAQTSDLTVPELRSKFPQVETAARIYNRAGAAIKSGSDVFYDDRVFYAEPEIFQILSIPVLTGDAASLSDPGSVLLSESLAQRLYGTSAMLGKMIEINDISYDVAGVVADPPTNGHLQYSCFVSHASLEKSTRQDWTRYDTGSYVKLKPQVNVPEFEQKLMVLTEEYVPALEGEKRHQASLLQPVADIHLTRNLMFDDDVSHGSRLFLMVLYGLSIIILIIACVNFVNLATACAATRFKEVGLRKVVGAQRRQLIHQFLGESTLLAVLAFVLALLIVIAALPRFSMLTGIPFDFPHLLQKHLIFLWIGLIVFVGILAGLYPALFMSSFDPLHILKKQTSPYMRGGSRLRRVLFIGQFSVSILLVIATVTMNHQIRFMKNHPLGFAKEQKLVIPLPQSRSQAFDYSFVKHELSNMTSIQSATLSSGVPGYRLDYAGTRRPGQQEEKPKRVYIFAADADFIETFQIDWASPRPSQEALISGLKNGVIVNETLVRDFGWKSIEDALGQHIESGSVGEAQEIIGVVRDFHFRGLNESIEALILTGSRPQRYRLITLAVDIQSLAAVLPFLKSKWDILFPERPFEYFFLDENFDRAYQKDEQAFQIVSAFSFLGICIACFGLFGLAAFMAERRTKEIGIRKILGGTTSSIVYLLYRDFSVWGITANILAWPAAFFIMHKWLQNFHFMIALNPGIFFSAGLITLVLVWMTVSYQAIKAARANPADSLRYE